MSISESDEFTGTKGKLAQHMRPVNHGLYMLLLRGHRKEGAFWAVLYLIVGAMVAYQIATLVVKYRSYPMERETTPMEPVHPAEHWPPVRLCPAGAGVRPSDIVECRLLGDGRRGDGRRCDDKWRPSAGGCLTYSSAVSLYTPAGRAMLRMVLGTAARLHLGERNGTQDGYYVTAGYTYKIGMKTKHVRRLPPPYGIDCVLPSAAGDGRGQDDRRRPCQLTVYEPTVVALPSEHKENAVIEFGPTTIEHVHEYAAYTLVQLLSDIGTQIVIWMALVYLIKLIFIAIQLVVIKLTN